MKPPPAIQAWTQRLGNVKWEKVWRLRSFFTTPRDQATWLKLIHRNLFVANRDPDAVDQTCKARDCGHDESMLHLARCTIITRDYWTRIENLLKQLDIPEGNGPRFWITGERQDGQYADREGAGVIFLAWRCLYAETIQARTKNVHLNLKRTYTRLILMIISRLKAQGLKWYRWFSRTRGHRETKDFPVEYRQRKLMITERDASYTISKTLLDEYERIKHDQ